MDCFEELSLLHELHNFTDTTPVDGGLPHPGSNRRLRQIEFLGDLAYALAARAHQADHLSFVLALNFRLLRRPMDPVSITSEVSTNSGRLKGYYDSLGLPL